MVSCATTRISSPQLRPRSVERRSTTSLLLAGRPPHCAKTRTEPSAATTIAGMRWKEYLEPPPTKMSTAPGTRGVLALQVLSGPESGQR